MNRQQNPDARLEHCELPAPTAPCDVGGVHNESVRKAKAASQTIFIRKRHRDSVIRIAVAAILAVSNLAAQPAFEAVSVRPGVSPRTSEQIDPGRLAITGLTLRALIQEAYSVPGYQTAGGPGWVDSDIFDIQATAAGSNSREQLLEMLRAALASRFGLVLHRETRALSGYSLTADKGGTKLQASKEAQTQIGLHPLVRDEGRSIRVILKKASMASLARYISQWMGCPVVDRTGLTGFFDFQRDLTLDTVFDPPTAFLEILPSLGLNLQPAKEPTEILVIDYATKPSRN